MLTLPALFIATFDAFAPLFSKPVFRHAMILMVGAILTPGGRTVTNCLRIMGLADTERFPVYHRVLSRDKWSSRKASKILLDLLLRGFAPTGPLVFGIDETLERRRGKNITARGVYHDAVRSSKSFFVKSTGLRWICLMLIAPISWANIYWALPFFTVLTRPKHLYKPRKRPYKKLERWARQIALQLRRWLPDRDIVLVADSSYSVLKFLKRCCSMKRPITVVTRLRRDAALYEPAPERQPGKPGRPRTKGEQLPSPQQVHDDPNTVWTKITIERWYSQVNREVEIASGTAVWYHTAKEMAPIRYVLIRDGRKKDRGDCGKPQDSSKQSECQALLCTDLSADPIQILSWFVQRWQMESTFHEARTHLGVETQRQWTDSAIARTTPALFGLFSLVTLLADKHVQSGESLRLRTAAWYEKTWPTFSDALASVRHSLFEAMFFARSGIRTDSDKFEHAFLLHIEDILQYATAKG